MNNIKYLKYILKHKYYVTKECIKHGIIWRGLLHDLSKFLPKEFKAYRNYFYGGYTRPYADFNSGMKLEFDCWSISKEGVQEAFDYAWLNHQHNNPHHWQYWLLKMDDGSIKVLPMPTVYVKEMISDWVGAGLAITGKLEVKLWYENNKHKMVLHPNTRDIVEKLINEY